MEGRWTLEALVEELGVPRSTLKHRIAQLNISPVARGARAKLYYGAQAHAQLMEAGRLLKEGVELPEVRQRLGLPADTSGHSEADGVHPAQAIDPLSVAKNTDASQLVLDDMARAMERLAQQMEGALLQLAAKDQHITRLSESLSRSQEQGAAQQAKALHLQAELVRVNKELDEARRLLANSGGGGASLLKRLWGPKEGEGNH